MKIRVIAALVLCCSACDVPAPVARPVTKPVEVKQSDAGEKAPVSAPQDESPDELLEFYRQFGCEEIISKLLVAPSTAKFSSKYDNEITQLPDYDVEGIKFLRRNIRGWVDSQNNFGAMVRSEWQLTFAFNPLSKKWEMWRLILGNEELFCKDGYIPSSNAYVSSSSASPDDLKPEKKKRQPKERKQLSDEQVAANKLKLAKILIGKNPEVARERLQEIADDYPDTDAADEANILLGDVKDD